jgi:hypothetical protein
MRASTVAAYREAGEGGDGPTLTRQLKWLGKRLRELAAMEISGDDMLMKLGAARSRAPGA